MIKNNYDLLIAKLDEFTRKFYTNQLIRGSIYALSILLFSYLLFAIMEFYGHYSSIARSVLFYLFMGIALLVSVKMIFLPLFRLYKLGKVISHEQAALIIGKYFQSIEDKLFNILQLKKQSEEKSSELLLASINQKIETLSPIPFTDAIDFRNNKKYLKYLAVPLCIFLIILLFSPTILREGTTRLVAYDTEFVPLAPFQFVVQNPELKGIKNEDFSLELKVQGEEIPSKVFIEIGNQKFLMKKNSITDFGFIFNNLQHDIDFKFSAEGFYSKTYQLKALPKAVLVNFKISADYPAYTGKKDEIIENFGDLNVPQGSYLSWIFSTENTEELHFITPDSIYQLPQTAENEFSHSNRFFNNLQYQITTQNNFINVSDTLSYSLSVSPDIYPSIEVEVRQDSSDKNKMYFKGFVKDDYGFSRLIFQYQYFSADGMSRLPVREELAFNKSLLQSDFFHLWDLSKYPIAAGDRVEYFFEVWDNDAVNGNKASRTAKMVYEAPTLQELAKMVEKSNQTIKSELEKSIDMAKEIQKDLTELNKKLLEKKNLGWQEKQKLEDILKKQNQVKENIQKLQQENEQMNKEKSSFRQIDEEILQKQELLEEMFDKLMSEEMKKLIEEMQELMQELNKDKLKDAIEKMALSNEDMEKELDRNLEIFKQLEFEQKLNETKEKLDELKKKQEELAEKSKEKDSDTEELQKKQEKLNKEFEDIRKQMDDLEKKNQALEEPNKMESTDQLEKEIEEKMQESSDQLNKESKSKASESQSGAKKKMDELSQKLGNMQMSMQGGANAENMEDLRSLLENLIQLSFDQESVMKELGTTDRNDPKYVQLSQRQRKLKDDSKMIEDSLFALSKRVIQIEPTINREINLINSNMDKALSQMSERKTSSALARQQLAMTSANNLALLLDQALQQMQKQMQQGKGNCSKPGATGKPSISDMKKMQEQLNKQLQQMKDGMKNGQKPGDKPGDKPGSKPGEGKGGMSKELAKMAAKQAAIREELQKMQEQINEGNGNSGGGNLKKLTELMEKTEVDLVNKRITQETINRQKEIMTRLLESEKAEREREKEEQRESKEANEEMVRNPNLFFEYNRQKEKEIELLKTLPPGFNIFYKNKVSEYLNQVER